VAELVAAMIGTLDTKGPEFEYLEAELRRCGLGTVMVDVSCLESRKDVDPTYSCEEVARRAGWDFGRVAQLDKRQAGNVMESGATAILQDLYRDGEIGGLIALGGANGTLMGCEVMKSFPIGFPKLMVSVVAASDPRENVGTKDIVLINSVTDLCLNQLTKQIIANAAAALAGILLKGRPVAESTGKLQVGATMLGLTQRCAMGASAALEAEGSEVLVFHANGIGGAALEDLIAHGVVEAVLDLTTNEVGNHLLGGVFDAGPERLEAAAARGIPQVVSPGAVDFVNFWGRSVPSHLHDRQFIFHNIQNTLMRTTTDENLHLGRIFAEKLNGSRGKAVVVVPLCGFSGNDMAGGPHGVTMSGIDTGPWHNPKADRAFLQGLQSAAEPATIDIWELEAHINDPAFIEAVISAFRACRSGSGVDGNRAVAIIDKE
jgi:uncharacterized protein (UPF0261 family)